ncbi:hypothetical protein E0L36_18855 [Streptomyces sp. AJS327]|uniref:hypothetical protein n=1 Tax=Streptomyces sp. AJS327 TaxID=2545265 RepID=UPI0015DE30F6|nr:hypothetical protein [Streptomyces sp. AJS327]MBA0052857.1 hypothetical protein [Streptomyces sp. AJS327]
MRLLECYLAVGAWDEARRLAAFLPPTTTRSTSRITDSLRELADTRPDIPNSLLDALTSRSQR